MRTDPAGEANKIHQEENLRRILLDSLRGFQLTEAQIEVLPKHCSTYADMLNVLNGKRNDIKFNEALREAEIRLGNVKVENASEDAGADEDAPR